MRTFERTFLLNSLCFAAIAAGTILACSTTNDPTATPTDEAGVVTPVDEGGTTAEAGPLPDGALPDTSVPQPKCTKSGDCASGVCNQATGQCVAADCKDGVKNAVETDLDCGGGDCPKCDVAKACKVAGDCVSGVCIDPDGKGKKCQAPTSTDMVKNGNETGVDCGGTANPTCANGQACATRADCTSLYCLVNVCTAPKPDDMTQNGTETDVDCGGLGAKPCADGKMCLVDVDCTSSVCKDLADGMGLRCQVPSYTDTKLNGNETDVDCGGDPAHPCATGQSCTVSADCTSLGCDYNHKCANARSCAPHYGGDTCGSGGEGGIGAAAWESCCKTIPVTTVSGGTVYMDKYPVTAGRMRAFLESPDVSYNVRGFVASVQAAGTMPKIPVTASTGTNPVVDGVHPVLDPAWNAYLPVSFAGNTDPAEIADCGQSGTCTQVNGECGPSKTCLAGTTQPGVYTSVRNHLGGFIFKNNSQSATGCYVGSPGTHSYRFPDDMQDGATPDQPVEVYDTKSLSCVDYVMAQAFCVWDGGRLETFQEWQAAYGTGATPYVAQTTTKPADPTQRCDAASSCVWTTAAQSKIDCKTSTTGLTCNGGVGKCCLEGGPTAAGGTGGGNQTYFGCRFPWATDADHAFCGVSWPATTSIEYSDYKYSYEYPKLTNTDFIVFLSAPGRTKGRGPLGHSDVIGTGFELTSSVTWNASPLDGRHRWTGNGSWEVHDYSRTYGGTSELINKYGKLGARCVKFSPAN
jgi:formylglycine-generating enzyme required for sulfatase activity